MPKKAEKTKVDSHGKSKGRGAKSPQPKPPRERATGVVLIPQPHGGAIYPPAKSSGNRTPSSWNALQRECVDLIQQATPGAIKAVIAQLDSSDPRAQLVAADMLMTRAFGRAGDAALQAGNGGEAFDVSLLTGDERLRLMQAMQIVTECKDLMRARSANRDGGTIEGNAAG